MPTADTQYPLHQINLEYNDGTEIDLLICDLQGNPDPTMLVVTQSQRVAAKLATGGVDHSDWEFPYTPVQQKSYTGGRAQLNIESDKTKFFHSHRMDSMIEGHLFLAGQSSYATGVRDFVQQIPDTHTSFTEIHGGDKTVIQIPFTPAANMTITEVWLIGTRYGNPGTCKVALHASAGDYAGAEQVFGTLYEDDVLEPLLSQELVVSMEEGYAVTSGTKYWIVITVDNNSDDDNHWRFYWTYDNTGSLSGDNTGDYSDSFVLGLQFYFRVTPEEFPFEAKFFRYKGATYVVTSYNGAANQLDDNGDPWSNTGDIDKPVKLFINGDQGILTAATAWSITDSTKSWTPGEFKGALLQLFDGLAANTPQRWRVIVDNDATTLLLDNALTVTPNPDADATQYNIIGSDVWNELAMGDAGEEPRGRCTDIVVSHQCVYFAFGDHISLYRMRRYRKNDDTWTTEWAVEDQGFTFLEEAPNSYGKNRIWGAKQDWPPRIDWAEPQWANWEQTVDELSWSQGPEAHLLNRIAANSSMEKTGSWTDLGNPTTNERGPRGHSGYHGAYGWKIESASDGDGAQQDVSIVDTYTYNVNCMVWIDTLPADGFVSTKVGSTVIDSTPANATSASIGGSWFRLKGHYIASTTGTVALQIYIDGGVGKICIDEFEMVRIPTYLEDLSSERITNLKKYGEPERLYVLTEGGIYKENMGYFQRIPLDEYQNAQDDRNGAVAFTYDVNLMISFLDGMQSYYRETLQNIGPDRGEGLPKELRGNVSSGVGMPGRYFISVNGLDKYSSILANNGRGFHPIYRGPKGKEIKGLFIQPVPGAQPDRLWFSQGEDLVYIHILPSPLKEV